MLSGPILERFLRRRLGRARKKRRRRRKRRKKTKNQMTQKKKVGDGSDDVGLARLPLLQSAKAAPRMKRRRLPTLIQERSEADHLVLIHLWKLESRLS